MAILGFELEEIARLMALVEARGLDELILEEDERQLRIRGPRPKSEPAPPHLTPEGVNGQTPFTYNAPQLPVPRSAPQKALASRSAAPTASKLSPPTTDRIELVAPMVGTFYRAEKPGGPPLIQVGQRVAIGQTIGLIEAMKVYSEVPADHAGLVTAIPAQDGQLVHPGTPLVILQKE
jgi:acetyl-CoA carboxylase biotin carboxyl carrier protein